MRVCRSPVELAALGVAQQGAEAAGDLGVERRLRLHVLCVAYASYDWDPCVRAAAARCDRLRGGARVHEPSAAHERAQVGVVVRDEPKVEDLEPRGLEHRRAQPARRQHIERAGAHGSQRGGRRRARRPHPAELAPRGLNTSFPRQGGNFARAAREEKIFEEINRE